MSQAARNLALREHLADKSHLVHDRDAKFSGGFDLVVRTEGVRVIKTPARAPVANTYAERFVGTVRRECLDWVIIFGRSHLERVLKEFIAHYNAERPHRSLGLATPIQKSTSQCAGLMDRIRRRTTVAGLVNEYYVKAA